MTLSQQGPHIFEAERKEPHCWGAGPSDLQTGPSEFCCELATGVPRSQENAPPSDSSLRLCLGTYGSPREVGYTPLLGPYDKTMPTVLGGS